MEIERRFLLSPSINSTKLVKEKEFSSIKQGYISIEDTKAIRIRSIQYANKPSVSYITIKKRIDALSSYEFEYSIPEVDAEQMLTHLTIGHTIFKKRYYIPQGSLVWEIDVFQEKNQGLIVAEIELPKKNTYIEIPDWIGKEITDNLAYSNASLCIKPYSYW